MQRNVTSQKITVLAIDTATNLPKTGDASNLTLYYNGDDGGVTVMSTNSGHPTEDDATNAPGCYSIALSQAETNYAKLNITGKSSTSGVRVIPVLNLQTVPAAFVVAGGAAGGLFIAGTNAATTVTTSFTTTFTGNLTGSVASVTARVSANTDQLAGQTVTAAAGVTFPASVASPTNITAATGIVLAASQHVIVDSGTVTTLSNLPAAPTDWLSAAAVSGGAVTKIQASLSTLTQTQVTGGAYSVQSASCVLGDPRIAHLNADVDSRMATYTQPTGFLAATFPLLVASTTNITGGTITTVSGNVNGSVGSLAGVTFPANFSTLSITAGAVDVASFGGSPVVHTLGKVWALDGNGNPLASASAVAALGSPQQVGGKYAVSLDATDVSGNLPSNVKAVNTITVTGTGTVIDPWGPV